MFLLFSFSGQKFEFFAISTPCCARRCIQKVLRLVRVAATDVVCRQCVQIWVWEFHFKHSAFRLLDSFFCALCALSIAPTSIWIYSAIYFFKNYFLQPAKKKLRSSFSLLFYANELKHNNVFPHKLQHSLPLGTWQLFTHKSSPSQPPLSASTENEITMRIHRRCDESENLQIQLIFQHNNI